MDRYEYKPERCNICGEDKDVRWKNLYLIGSEGIYICHPCEMDLLEYLRKKSREFQRAKIERIKNERRLN
jgi:hypothetical protein